MIYKVQKNVDKDLFDCRPKHKYCIFFTKNKSLFFEPICGYCKIWQMLWCPFGKHVWVHCFVAKIQSLFLMLIWRYCKCGQNKHIIVAKTITWFWICTFANRIKYCAYNQVNWITMLSTFERILPCIHNIDVDRLKHNESSTL